MSEITALYDAIKDRLTPGQVIAIIFLFILWRDSLRPLKDVLILLHKRIAESAYDIRPLSAAVVEIAKSMKSLVDNGNIK